MKTNKKKTYKKLSYKEKYFIEVDKAAKRCEKIKEISMSEFFEKFEKNLIKKWLVFNADYFKYIKTPDLNKSVIQINTSRGKYVVREDVEVLIDVLYSSNSSNIINLHDAINERNIAEFEKLSNKGLEPGKEIDKESILYLRKLLEIVCR